MASNVTPSIPGAPSFCLAIAYAVRRVSILQTWTYSPQKRQDGGSNRTSVPQRHDGSWPIYAARRARSNPHRNPMSPNRKARETGLNKASSQVTVYTLDGEGA